MRPRSEILKLPRKQKKRPVTQAHARLDWLSLANEPADWLKAKLLIGCNPLGKLLQ